MKFIAKRSFFFSRKARIGSVSLGLLGVIGCGAIDRSVTPVVQSQVALHGKTFGGQQPVVGAAIYLVAVGIGGYGSAGTVLAHAVTDSAGNFDLGTSFTCPQVDTPEYIISVGGNPGLGGPTTNPNIVLGTALLPCGVDQPFVNIDELSTVVMAYSMAQFFTTTYGVPSQPTLGQSTVLDGFGGPSSLDLSNSQIVYSLGLTNAMNKTVPSLLNSATGQLQPASPTFGIEAAKISSIANALAACVNSKGETGMADNTSSCGKLFSATTSGSNRPGDTLQAAVAMALHPYQNVAVLYGLGGTTPPYQPTLANAPHDLTVGVSYITPGVKLTVGATPTSPMTSNLAIDAGGDIWLPTTAPAGVMSFSPGANTFGGPYTTNGILGPQNVTIDREGLVWSADNLSNSTQIFSVSSLAGGTPTLYPQNTGNATAVTIDPNDGVVNIGVDGGGAPYLLNLNYPRAIGNQQPSNIVPSNTVSSVTGATDGNQFPVAGWAASYSGTTSFMESSENGANAVTRATFPGGGSGQIAQYAPYNFVMTTPLTNTACIYTTTSSCLAAGFTGMNTPEGVAVDGNNYIWVANSGNASVSEFPGSNANFAGGNAGFSLHGSADGGTMVQPFGIGIDNSGNVWVSNQTIAGGSYVLSELIGAGAPTITPIYAQYAGGRNAVGTPSQNALISIGAGSTTAVGSFIADTDFAVNPRGVQGSATNNHTTDTTNVAYAAPPAVYQSERAGQFTYTVPGFAPNSTHTVLLHFSETFFTGPNERVFDIAINGAKVLTNFDIFARVGANKALVLPFTTNADSKGAIAVTFLRGLYDQPKLSAIQVQ